ncbi:MAG: START-like domain-containing protein [Bacteroidota bacterium]
MSKHRYSAEFEMKASPKMLFPYLNSASGLSEWFADNVNIDEKKVFHFIWDGVNHSAKLTAQRTNKYVKFDFIEDGEEENNPFIEFKLDQNELTQSTYLKVVDYSEVEDEQDLLELWANLVEKLRELVGG